jgi:hypothetical protein
MVRVAQDPQPQPGGPDLRIYILQEQGSPVRLSGTELNRLMLFGETVAVYCENHMEHTDKVRTSQETHYVSVTEPNRLMLFGETVAVYCENRTEKAQTHYMYRVQNFKVKAASSWFIW